MAPPEVSVIPVVILMFCEPEPDVVDTVLVRSRVECRRESSASSFDSERLEDEESDVMNRG